MKRSVSILYDSIVNGITNLCESSNSEEVISNKGNHISDAEANLDMAICDNKTNIFYSPRIKNVLPKPSKLTTANTNYLQKSFTSDTPTSTLNEESKVSPEKIFFHRKLKKIVPTTLTLKPTSRNVNFDLHQNNTETKIKPVYRSLDTARYIIPLVNLKFALMEIKNNNKLTEKIDKNPKEFLPYVFNLVY